MDSQRFTQIFSKLQSGLRRVALRIVGNEEEAADAVQDVFVNLWRRREEVADDGSVEKLMSVSVRNRCITGIRARNRHPFDPLEEGETHYSLDGDDEAEAAMLYEEVQHLMSEHLSERDREILTLREQSGWDFKEIATRFGMTEASVRMALSRARRAVLKAYKDRNQK